jgi:hypothetical protein
MNDTPREIANRVRELLLARSGAERLMMGSQMFEVARTMMLASFPAGLSAIEVRRRLCERLYSGEVNVEAFVQSLVNHQPRRL